MGNVRLRCYEMILCAKGEDGAMLLWGAPVGEVPEEIRAALEEGHAPSVYGEQKEEGSRARP